MKEKILEFLEETDKDYVSKTFITSNVPSHYNRVTRLIKELEENEKVEKAEMSSGTGYAKA